jgi:hypothetical protein
MIVIDSNNFNYEVDEHKLSKYKNVISYNYINCSPTLNVEICENNINNAINNDTEYYYIFDCPGRDAFAHWIFESFIFFDYFLKINELHPTIKILTTNTKKYVSNYFKLFNVNNEIVNEITSHNNVCFFSPVLSLNSNNINQDLFKNLLDNYVKKINSLIDNNVFENNIIFLPRNSKDNFANNDRIIHGSDMIEESVINLGGSVLNTYQINNLKTQFVLINSSNTIILDYGSSLFVNCIFLKGKKIIILDNYKLSHNQINNYIFIKIIYDRIINNNDVVLVKSEKNNTIDFNDIKNFL